ncbi:hypothetical protein [Paenibacillus sacheonensis]|uniref:Uncharacterized protein n=1 Tax=Paenibacillus sacheonensis TaxID=742054 RepID=A0A7X4YS93_9BACL|nr:hypothetical protein [Paenibacillus sacheonensis]MBM7566415.1 hypothetical protein [Paenibacillus sacheonensis]NBC70614.1 hypothetical protein [Paenibacillus sacheonensis]
MIVTKLQFDTDFDNAILFGHYVMVLTNEKMSGGGLLEAFDDDHAWINGKRHSRAGSSFIQMPPPDMYIDFSNESE